MANNTPSSQVEDSNSTAASWIVAAILIAAVVIAGFYFLTGTNSAVPEIPNTGTEVPQDSETVPESESSQ